MARRVRLTGVQRTAQLAATVALQTAHEQRDDARRYQSCIAYAARVIEATRNTVELVDRNSNRAWRD